MKKIIAAIFLVIVVMAAADSARADSSAISKQEWAEIKEVARSAYPRDAQVEMVTTDEWFCTYTLVELFTPRETEDVELHVYPAQAFVIIHRVGSWDMMGTAQKIKGGIENILNRSAREALER